MKVELLDVCDKVVVEELLDKVIGFGLVLDVHLEH